MIRNLKFVAQDKKIHTQWRVQILKRCEKKFNGPEIFFQKAATSLTHYCLTATFLPAVPNFNL